MVTPSFYKTPTALAVFTVADIRGLADSFGHDYADNTYNRLLATTVSIVGDNGTSAELSGRSIGVTYSCPADVVIESVNAVHQAFLRLTRTASSQTVHGQANGKSLYRKVPRDILITEACVAMYSAMPVDGDGGALLKRILEECDPSRDPEHVHHLSALEPQLDSWSCVSLAPDFQVACQACGASPLRVVEVSSYGHATGLCSQCGLSHGLPNYIRAA